MSDQPLLWPRMDLSTATKRLAKITAGEKVQCDTDLKYYSFNGVGTRVTSSKVVGLRDLIVERIGDFGFNRRHGFEQQDFPSSNEEIKQIDTVFFRTIHSEMPMTWDEASSKEVWSWVALALLPDVTYWRWRSASKNKGENGELAFKWNKDRWIARDLGRHAWSRYWWRKVRFEGNEEVLLQLSESEVTELIERRETLGPHPRLMGEIARVFLAAREAEDFNTRFVIRDVAKRLNRDMAYMDPVSLSDEELYEWVQFQMHATLTELHRTEGAG